MKSRMRYFACIAALLIAAVLPVSAGSTKTYNYSDPVTDLKGFTGVTTNFTFNSKTDKISKGTLTFSGVFGSYTVNFSGLATLSGGSWVFDLSKKVNVNGTTYLITDVINLSNLSASGTLWNGKTGKKSLEGYFDGPFVTTPEGGSRFSYLAPAGLVMLGAIFLNGLRRPGIRNLESASE